MIDFSNIKAASFRAYLKDFKPITRFDNVRSSDLMFLESAYSELASNMSAFLNNEPYSHVILSGAKGCGKTSLIKAIFNEFSSKGLKLAEVFKEDLEHLRQIIDELSMSEFKFLIFLDDLSFEPNDASFKLLKPLLDGGIEPLSSNLMFVVSSNYRNLIRHENAASTGLDNSDEQYSLKERFGIWLSFYNFSQEQYLALIDNLFSDYDELKRAKLHAAALEFATLKASRNGRIAKQFYEQYRRQND